MSALVTLPCEILLIIISNIEFEDVINLMGTCQIFRNLFNEENTSKTVVRTKIGFSNEAQCAMTARCGYAVALRRAAKRRQALATAKPFTVAIVGFGYTFLYCKGVLCYTLDDRIRLLDLHNSAHYETIIDVSRLRMQIPEIATENIGEVIQILYYADDIISYLYKTSGPDSRPWLIAFNIIKKKILVTEELATTNGVFVRHNKSYLYHGALSGIDTNADRSWEIHGYDLNKGEKFPEVIERADIAQDIGFTICFELYNEYFYILSNQTHFDFEDTEFTSAYHCIRFPVESPCKKYLEETTLWRRQHGEGPINRLGGLHLEEDETTGKFQIVEMRAEWLVGSTESKVTTYMTEIIFPEDDESESSIPESPASPPLRLPQNTHPYNNESHDPTKSQICHYYTSASTYLDLFNDLLPTDSQETRRLRLCACSRKLGQSSSDLVTYWPPSQDPECQDAGLEKLYRLLNPPTHMGHVRGTADERSLVFATGETLQATADGRSLVDVTGKKLQAIVFIGFDPAIKLAGLKRWSESYGKGEGIDESETDDNKSEIGKSNKDWAWTEKAMYWDIGLQVNLGLCKLESSLSASDRNALLT